MTKIEPDVRATETYRESNFLRVHTERPRGDAGPQERSVTIEHLRYEAGAGNGGWRCETVVDREPMSTADALFIAKAYAREHGIPVIYECHGP